MSKLFRSFIALIACTAIVFVAVSILDLLISKLYEQFYSSFAFIVTYACGGILAAVTAYMSAMEQLEHRSITGSIIVIVILFTIGMLFTLVFGKLEGGIYEPACKAFGATLAMGSVLFLSDIKK